MATEGVHFITLLHLACGTFYIISLYHDLKVPYQSKYGGRWKYLTFIDLIFQLAYFVGVFLVDVVTLVKGKETPWMIKLRDLFYAAVAFPFGVFVAATFWGIYFVDRELIFPKALDAFFPSWLNHALHTWCAVLVIVEGALVRHRYPSNKSALSVLLGIALVYLLWVCWLAYAVELWVYPFLRVMTDVARAIFFTLCAFILVFFFWMGKWMNSAIWGSAVEVESGEARPQAKRKAKKAE